MKFVKAPHPLTVDLAFNERLDSFWYCFPIIYKTRGQWSRKQPMLAPLENPTFHLTEGGIDGSTRDRKHWIVSGVCL